MRALVLAGLCAGAGAVPGNIGLDHVGFTVPNVAEAAEFLIELFDCTFDWEVKRQPEPTSGEQGWDKKFGVHPDSHMPHVMMLKCGKHHLAQYIELFEWVSPDQHKPEPWNKFSDVGHGYFAFTVKDIKAVMAAVKASRWWGLPGVRFLQDPPMSFPLRGEICTSSFLVTPWGQWLEVSEWSESGPKAEAIDSCESAAAEKDAPAQRLLADVPTPAWVVDLDAMDHNIALFKSRLGSVDWRPPVKAHKSPALAKRLIAAGAKGVITLKVSEAEVFAANGIDDIYVANCVVTPHMITRLVRLAGRTKRVRVHVESKENLEAIAATAQAAGLQVEVLVEVNIGHNRTGVDSPEAAADLAKAVVAAQKETGAVKFVGVTGYEGHTPVLPPEQKTAETKRCHKRLRDAADAVEAAGIAVGVISAGGSSNYVDALGTGVLTELQAGGVALIDKLYNTSAGLGAHGHRIGSLIVTTVVSVAADGSRAMADAGFKAVGWHPFAGLPVVMDHHKETVAVAGLSAEHLKLKPAAEGERLSLKVGDRITLSPGYTDAMGLMHRSIYAVRDGVVEDVWPVLAAGSLV